MTFAIAIVYQDLKRAPTTMPCTNYDVDITILHVLQCHVHDIVVHDIVMTLS